MTRAHFAGLLTILAAIVFTPDSHAAKLFDFHETTLDNGMRVVTLEDFSTPIVAVQVWYHVGSKDEDPARQGFAHMFEHMMFAGTDRLGAEEHGALLREVGGECNAFTNFDYTAYVNVAPANQLELMLWLESERLMYLKVSQESFDTERQVVEEERRMGINQPYGSIAEQVLPVVFTAHPYKWLPIGNIPHLRAAKLSELQQFWDRFYLPSNATLAIVGAVKHKDAQDLAKKYFGWMPGGDVAAQSTTPEPPQEAERTIALEEPFGPVPAAGFLYRGVPVKHADAIPLELLMMVLGGGESSRMYLDLVKERRLCLQAMAETFLLEADGVFGAGAALNPTADMDKALAAIEEHLKRVTEEPLQEKELTKAKNQLRRQVVTEALTVENKAQAVGEAALLHGSPEWLNEQLADIEAVTLDDVLRVAKEYVRPERRTVIRITPNPEKKVDENEDAPVAPHEEPGSVQRSGIKVEVKHPGWFPEKPPVSAMLDSIPVLDTKSRTLDNGLRIEVVPNHEVPFVTVMLGSKYGAWAEDAAQPGVASMTYSMLTKGTENYTAAELAEAIEFNALTLEGVASMDEAQILATGLAEKLPLAVELLAEVCLRPVFPEDELAVLKEQVASTKSVDEGEPRYVVERELSRALFGAHPYSRNATGELADIPGITADMLKQFRATYFRPDTTVVYVAGDVKPEDAFKLVEQHLGAWKAEGATPQPALPAIPEPGKTHILLLDRPGAVQSQISVGQVSITRNDPLFHYSRVYSQIFGGAYESRLNRTIRIERGLTYGAFGVIRPNRYAGQFVSNTFTKTESTAETVQAILDVITGMKTTPPTDSELTTAKAYLTGSFPAQLETPQDTVGYAWIIEYSGLPKDYLTQAVQGYREASLADVENIATAVVKPDQLTIVVAGEAAKIREALEKIAPVKVVEAPKEDAPAQPAEARPAA